MPSAHETIHIHEYDNVSVNISKIQEGLFQIKITVCNIQPQSYDDHQRIYLLHSISEITDFIKKVSDAYHKLLDSEMKFNGTEEALSRLDTNS